MKNNNRKAQITLFVIIGLVLLLVVALLLFLPKLKTSKITPGAVTTPILEVSAVEGTVKQCLYAVGKEGVQKLGAHGGYIYPEKFGIISNPFLPTESSGISIFGDSDVIPYWFYLKSSNTCKTGCVVTSEQPPLSLKDGDRSMESQLKSYIEEKIGECLNNLSIFEQNYSVQTQIIGKPSVDVYIKDETVSLILKQTIKASYKGEEKTFEAYQAELPVRLKQAYDTMSNIIDESRKTSIRFFERSTISMISSYTLGEDPALPPMEGAAELGRNAKHWSFQRSKDFIQILLEDDVSLFSVDKTRNSRIIITSDPFFNGLYMNFILSIPGMINPEDYSVDFLYLQDWPIYADIQKRKGDDLAPDITSWFLGLLTFTTRQFSYDISYPIVIMVKDHEAFGGEGFTFQAATEVNIRNNEPLNISGNTPLLSGQSITLFCDYNQRKSGDITVTLTSTEPPVPEDVVISYECGDESCFMGSTESQGYLTTKFPLCADGYVKASAEDYFSKPMRLSTGKDMPATVNLIIEPYKELNVEIKKAVLTKILTGSTPTWVFDPTKIMDLAPDDKATFVLSREPGIAEPDTVESVEINGKKLDEPKTIRLISGNYSLSGFAATNLGSDSISQRVITVTDPATGETYTNSELYLSGKIDLNNETSGVIIISNDDLAKGKVTFIIPYVDSGDITTYEESAAYLDAFTNLPLTNRADLLPRFG
jgi:hypothetical protein